MKLRRLAEMLFHRSVPTRDERSIKAEQIDAADRDLDVLAEDTERTLDRIDRLVPPQYRRFDSYRRVRVGR